MGRRLEPEQQSPLKRLQAGQDKEATDGTITHNVNVAGNTRGSSPIPEDDVNGANAYVKVAPRKTGSKDKGGRSQRGEHHLGCKRLQAGQVKQANHGNTTHNDNGTGNSRGLLPISRLNEDGAETIVEVITGQAIAAGEVRDDLGQWWTSDQSTEPLARSTPLEGASERYEGGEGEMIGGSQSAERREKAGLNMQREELVAKKVKLEPGKTEKQNKQQQGTSTQELKTMEVKYGTYEACTRCGKMYHFGSLLQHVNTKHDGKIEPLQSYMQTRRCTKPRLNLKIGSHISTRIIGAAKVLEVIKQCQPDSPYYYNYYMLTTIEGNRTLMRNLEEQKWSSLTADEAKEQQKSEEYEHWDKKGKGNVAYTVETATTTIKEEMRKEKDWRGNIMLKTGCTSNVAGETWVECYMKSLPEEERNKVSR